MPDSEVRVFQSATRLRCIDIGTPFKVAQIHFPNLCLCWDKLTHVGFPGMSTQVSLAHELMKLCANLRWCHIRLESHRDTLDPVWIQSHSPSIRVPYLWKLEIYQHDEEYVTRVFHEFLRPLVMSDLRRFDFPLEEELNIVPTLTELTTIINSLSRHALVSELSYVVKTVLTHVTGTLPFVASLKGPRSVLKCNSNHGSKRPPFKARLPRNRGRLWNYGRFYRHVGDKLGWRGKRSAVWFLQCTQA